MTTLTLARLASEAGLPDGVFNVVTGGGADVGTRLAGHAGVDMVTFTGSTPVGRKVMAAAAVHERATDESRAVVEEREWRQQEGAETGRGVYTHAGEDVRARARV